LVVVQRLATEDPMPPDVLDAPAALLTMTSPEAMREIVSLTNADAIILEAYLV
jgi:hypothetical protein